jgi:hypothetical protein
LYCLVDLSREARLLSTPYESETGLFQDSSPPLAVDEGLHLNAEISNLHHCAPTITRKDTGGALLVQAERSDGHWGQYRSNKNDSSL